MFDKDGFISEYSNIQIPDINYKYNIILIKDATKFYHIIHNFNKKITNLKIEKFNKKILCELLKKSNIILSDFCLQKKKENQIILRYDLIRNIIYGGNDYIFIDKDNVFSNKQLEFFLTDVALNKILNKRYFKILLYRSKLLNHFNRGFVFDDLSISGDITLSKYGRWYWKNDKIQNSIEMRKRIKNKILEKDGIYLNIDLISAEPLLLSKYAESKNIKNLIKSRIKHYDDLEYSKAIKNFINIHIHSGEINEYYIKKNYNILTKYIDGDIYDKIIDDLNVYYDRIINKYDKNMFVYEDLRRKIEPCYYDIDREDNDVIKNLIKNHNSYLQGHAHDTILNISKILYEKYKYYPLYTIHDSMIYSIDRKDASFVECINNDLKSLKIPVTIEMIE